MRLTSSLGSHGSFASKKPAIICSRNVDDISSEAMIATSASEDVLSKTKRDREE